MKVSKFYGTKLKRILQNMLKKKMTNRLLDGLVYLNIFVNLGENKGIFFEYFYLSF